MDLPNEDTLKIIEERKKYLIQKSEKTSSKNSYELREIKALDKIINLIKIFQNNLFYDFKKEIAENISNEKVNEEELNDDKNYKILHIYEQKMTKNSKLDVKFIEMKSNSKKYIILALKVYKEKLLKWVYQGKIELTPIILEEILNKSNEIMNMIENQ